jgi:hypothetical protein
VEWTAVELDAAVDRDPAAAEQLEVAAPVSPQVPHAAVEERAEEPVPVELLVCVRLDQPGGQAVPGDRRPGRQRDDDVSVVASVGRRLGLWGLLGFVEGVQRTREGRTALGRV